MVLSIRLHSFEEVCTLVDLATAQPFRVRISDGHHWADPKSLMYLFSLDLRRPLTLQVDCSGEESEALRLKLKDLCD